MKAAVFLDRDGLINKKASPHCYITTENDLVILPKVKEAVELLKSHNYYVFVITNQRGVARGIMSMDEVDRINCLIVSKYKIPVDEFFVCPHNEGECECRKPKIGLFLQAEEKYDIDKANSWMIGDSQSDIEAGENYGVKTILTTDLYSAVKDILKDNE